MQSSSQPNAADFHYRPYPEELSPAEFTHQLWKILTSTIEHEHDLHAIKDLFSTAITHAVIDVGTYGSHFALGLKKYADDPEKHIKALISTTVDLAFDKLLHAIFHEKTAIVKSAILFGDTMTPFVNDQLENAMHSYVERLEIENNLKSQLPPSKHHYLDDLSDAKLEFIQQNPVLGATLPFVMTSHEYHHLKDQVKEEFFALYQATVEKIPSSSNLATFKTNTPTAPATSTPSAQPIPPLEESRRPTMPYEKSYFQKQYADPLLNLEHFGLNPDGSIGYHKDSMGVGVDKETIEHWLKYLFDKKYRREFISSEHHKKIAKLLSKEKYQRLQKDVINKLQQLTNPISTNEFLTKTDELIYSLRTLIKYISKREPTFVKEIENKYHPRKYEKNDLQDWYDLTNINVYKATLNRVEQLHAFLEMKNREGKLNDIFSFIDTKYITVAALDTEHPVSYFTDFIEQRLADAKTNEADYQQKSREAQQLIEEETKKIQFQLDEYNKRVEKLSPLLEDYNKEVNYLKHNIRPIHIAYQAVTQLLTPLFEPNNKLSGLHELAQGSFELIECYFNDRLSQLSQQIEAIDPKIISSNQPFFSPVSISSALHFTMAGTQFIGNQPVAHFIGGLQSVNNMYSSTLNLLQNPEIGSYLDFTDTGIYCVHYALNSPISSLTDSQKIDVNMAYDNYFHSPFAMVKWARFCYPLFEMAYSATPLEGAITTYAPNLFTLCTPITPYVYPTAFAINLFQAAHSTSKRVQAHKEYKQKFKLTMQAFDNAIAENLLDEAFSIITQANQDAENEDDSYAKHYKATLNQKIRYLIKNFLYNIEEAETYSTETIASLLKAKTFILKNKPKAALSYLEDEINKHPDSQPLYTNWANLAMSIAEEDIWRHDVADLGLDTLEWILRRYNQTLLSNFIYSFHLGQNYVRLAIKERLRQMSEATHKLNSLRGKGKSAPHSNPSLFHDEFHPYMVAKILGQDIFFSNQLSALGLRYGIYTHSNLPYAVNAALALPKMVYKNYYGAVSDLSLFAIKGLDLGFNISAQHNDIFAQHNISSDAGVYHATLGIQNTMASFYLLCYCGLYNSIPTLYDMLRIHTQYLSELTNIYGKEFGYSNVTINILKIIGDVISNGNTAANQLYPPANFLIHFVLLALPFLQRHGYLLPAWYHSEREKTQVALSKSTQQLTEAKKELAYIQACQDSRFRPLWVFNLGLTNFFTSYDSLIEKSENKINNHKQQANALQEKLNHLPHLAYQPAEYWGGKLLSIAALLAMLSMVVDVLAVLLNTEDKWDLPSKFGMFAYSGSQDIDGFKNFTLQQ